MKTSKLFLKTLKENPKDADSKNQSLLIRAGFIYQNNSGIFSMLPLGMIVLEKISKIVDEHMKKSEAQKVQLPLLTSADLWKKTGRWEIYGDELIKLQDRKNKRYALSPTAEESITELVSNYVTSYKDLPINLYQINTKFRDELRPRFGMIRAKEFLMKDSYSFHEDEECLEKEFIKMRKTYINIFNDLKLDFKICEADSGAIGGNGSLEFIVTTDAGESEILFSNNYAANVEKAIGIPIEKYNEDLKQLKSLETKDKKTIKEVSSYLNLTEDKCLKSIIYKIDNDFYNVIVRGNDEVNELKVKNLLNAFDITKARDDEILSLNLIKGYIGPLNSKIKVIADEEAIRVPNHIIGANKKDFHLINVNYSRDWKADIINNIREAKEGDLDLKGLPLKKIKGIEVGHIFKLGKKYSEVINASYVDKLNNKNFIQMGCYGIGVSRILASIVEQNNDEKGIIWPKSVAPYLVNIVIVNTKDNDQIEKANEIYNFLMEKKIDVILDDRSLTVGIKLKESELLGFPYRILIGKNILSGEIEIFNRIKNSFENVKINDFINKLENFINLED